MHRLLPFVLLLAACHDSGNHDTPDLALAIPPYHGPLTLPTTANIDWTGVAGEGPLEAIHFTNGRGSVQFDGTKLDAIVYEKIPFAPYTLAAIAATTSDGLLIAYAYCQTGGVTALYTETLQQSTTPQDSVANAGTCAFVDSSSPGEVMFDVPGALAYGPVEDLADVVGSALTIHGGTGTLTIDGVAYDLVVFTGVDCATCGGSGWQELHVTLRHGPELAFAILYLKADTPSSVQLAYGIRFDQPMLWPPDAIYAASWTLK